MKFQCNATAAGRRIQARAAKRGKLATIPITQAMARIIDSMSAGRMLILANESGEPLSGEWLSKAVKRAARAAGVRGNLRLYNARGACVTRLVIGGRDAF